MELYLALIVFAAFFIVTVSGISLSLSKENKTINFILLILGLAAAFLLSPFLPRGISELAIFASLFGLIIAFYEISERRKDLPAIPAQVMERIYWVLSGIFCYTVIIFLLEFVSDNSFNRVHLVFAPLAVVVGVFAARKMSELSPSLRIFASSFFLLAIPSVYRPFADFMHYLIHEVVHLNYVTFMFPDHPFLEPAFYEAAMNTVYNPVVTGFGIFAFVIILSLITLGITYWRAGKGVPAADEITARKYLALERKKWRVFLSLILITGLVMFSSAMSRMKAEHGNVSETYPVQADNGYITLSTSKPLYQISEGGLKKYKYDWNGQPIVFILFRWNGQLKVVMDYCEFCRGEEEGYLLKNGQLVCEVCKTAILPETVGSPGGCNPVPVKTRIDNYVVKIKVSDLVGQFKSKKAAK